MADLWDTHLPHLREELYGEGLFVYNPNTGCYGFQEEEDEDETSGNELMAALLREAAEEDEEGVRGLADSGSFRLQPDSLEESFAMIAEDVPGHSYDLNQPSSEEEDEEEEQEQEKDRAETAATSEPEASALPEDCKCCANLLVS